MGTAGFEATTLRSVFVLPECHGQGVGAALMADVESRVAAAGVALLTVPASIAGEGFYRTLGYIVLRDELSAGGRTIIMEKRLNR